MSTTASNIKPSSEPSAEDIRKSRIVLITFLALFTAPVIIAYTVLKTDYWKSREATHHGELIQPPMHTENLQITPLQGDESTQLPTGKWLLVYASTENCNDACQNSLYIMKQVHTGLGPTQHRVEEHILLQNSALPTQIDLDNNRIKQQQWSWTRSADTANLTPGNLYIVDPLGNIILQYTIKEDRQGAILQAKGLLRDLKKLLKLSRIG